MRKIKKKAKRLILMILLVLLLFNAFVVGMLIYNTSPVSDNDKEKIVVIKEGSSHDDIGKLLKENNLIRSKKMFDYYVKIYKLDNIYAATYKLKESMSLKEIIKALKDGGYNTSELTITFNEGINMRKVAKIISENTNNTEEDVFNLLKDQSYLDELIEKYWFITDEIKNKDIYYSLEGYLFPETYNFASKDVTVKEIFDTMLKQEELVLNSYKKQISESNYSLHELLTLASITHAESYNNNDFKNVASVFYNRLKNGNKLESCVTAYYGMKKDMNEELYKKDLDNVNKYNTYKDGTPTLLPIGPVSNPGKDALDAVFNPIKTDYYFFVSDINNKLYFSKTDEEHDKIIRKLQNEGLWLEW